MSALEILLYIKEIIFSIHFHRGVWQEQIVQLSITMWNWFVSSWYHITCSIPFWTLFTLFEKEVEKFATHGKSSNQKCQRIYAVGLPIDEEFFEIYFARMVVLTPIPLYKNAG